MNMLGSAPAMSSTPVTTAESKRPINVLFVIDHLVRLGGGEAALLRMVRLLPKDRFRCFVVTLSGGIAPHVMADLPCPAYEFDMARTYSLKALKRAIQIRRLIRQERVDIVHTFFETSNTWGGLVARISGVPVLVSSRRDMGILRTGKHKLAYLVINRLCDKVVAVCEEVRLLCINQEHLDPQKVVTIYNGIELDAIDAAQSADLTSLHIPDPNQVIITTANIRKVKGCDVLAKAAALVVREFPNATFLIAGSANEPESVEEVRQLARDAGIEDRVKILGRRHDVTRLLKSSQIFCMPSRSEGFSNSILEAMACRLPCIVTRVGGNPEAVVDGVTGFLVASEDHEATAARICDLLRDPGRAAEMGRAGRDVVVAKFSSEHMIGEVMRFYEGLVRRDRR